ncbi:MAG: DUF2190 family protein [Acidobacteria bacterium]|nr:DUF2190 family protein [Acidobacteriota bacterium]NIQ86296.1 DUF2190 family protein [Acidobacteriota bacterium]
MKLKAATTTSPPEVEYAGAGEQHIGHTERDAASGAEVAIRLRNAEGTRKATAAGAFSIGATIYGAASGKVDDAISGTAFGLALEAATADGDIVEIIDDVGGY